MAVVSIDYEDGNDPTELDYRKVELWFGPKEIYTSSLGEFHLDWYKVIRSLIHQFKLPSWSYSSSVTHFLMDGAPFFPAYAVLNDTEDIPIFALKHEGRLKGPTIYLPNTLRSMADDWDRKEITFFDVRDWFKLQMGEEYFEQPLLKTR